MNYDQLITYDYTETKILPNGAIVTAARSRKTYPSIWVIKDDRLILTIRIIRNDIYIQCHSDNEEFREDIASTTDSVMPEDGMVMYSAQSNQDIIGKLKNIVYYAGQI